MMSFSTFLGFVTIITSYAFVFVQCCTKKKDTNEDAASTKKPVSTKGVNVKQESGSKDDIADQGIELTTMVDDEGDLTPLSLLSTRHKNPIQSKRHDSNVKPKSRKDERSFKNKVKSPKPPGKSLKEKSQKKVVVQEGSVETNYKTPGWLTTSAQKYPLVTTPDSVAVPIKKHRVNKPLIQKDKSRENKAAKQSNKASLQQRQVNKSEVRKRDSRSPNLKSCVSKTSASICESRTQSSSLSKTQSETQSESTCKIAVK